MNIHPQTRSSSSSFSSSPPLPPVELASHREIYTIWMKSLMFNGNGCTVYDSSGRIVYRVDNYDRKSSDEIYLMDYGGNTLLKILRKKLRVLGRWEGYRCSSSVGDEKQPWFSLRRSCRILNGDRNRDTAVVAGKCGDNPTYYKMEGMRPGSYYRITDLAGGLVVEIKRKQTTTGVALGDDVLVMVVEPNTDHLLIMGLMLVCGLINHSM